MFHAALRAYSLISATSKTFIHQRYMDPYPRPPSISAFLIETLSTVDRNDPIHVFYLTSETFSTKNMDPLPPVHRLYSRFLVD